MANAGAIRKRWFGETRTLEEQMRGLEPALAEAKRKTVLDLGCAEGLISREFVTAGATRVIGIDCNADSIDAAHALRLDSHVARFVVHNMNKIDADVRACCHANIVLALAVMHKMRDPDKALREWSQFAIDLMVIRLPGGSNGFFRSKHSQATCDTKQAMPECGFQLETVLQGPRDELVQYWRRC